MGKPTRTAGSGRSASGAKKPAGKRGKPTGAKVWLKRIGLTALVSALVLALLGVAGGLYLYFTVKLPDPNADFQTNTTHIYYRDGSTELGRLAVQNRETIPYAEMPQNVKDAIVAIENQSFWTDRGISLWGMARGAFSILTGGNLQGGSTITQQYIKILYLTSDQTVTRKVKELILAYKMGQELSKEQILEGYLNTIYFGRGAYGIQAAAKAFYGIPAKDMNLAQAVAMAAVMNDPGGFDPPRGNVKLLLERYQVTLNNMRDMGKITQKQRDAVYWKLPDFPEQKRDQVYGGPRGFLMKSVETELRERGFSDAEIKGGGLRVTTTIDQTMQQAATDAVQKNVAAANANVRRGADRNAVRSGLASVQVGTGEVLAMYGGPDYVKDSRNWATTPRPTASVFKINAVVAALSNGLSLATKLDGNTFVPPGDRTSVVNADRQNFGQVSLLKATSSSINTAFVDLVMKMPDGPNKVIAAANALGIPAGQDWDPHSRIALGFAHVSPLAEAGAIATIANGGRYVAPHFVKQVTDSKGTVLYTADDKGEQRIPANVAADTMYALTKVISEGTGRSLQALGFPAGGKTGTRDADSKTLAAWFSGTTAQIATAVDFVAGEGGNLDLNPYRQSGPNFYGSSYPASAWLDYMKVAMKGQERKEFPKPAWVNDGKQDEAPTIVPTPTVISTPTAIPTPTVASPSLAPSPTPAPTPDKTPGSGAPSSAPTSTPKPTPTVAPTRPGADPTPKRPRVPNPVPTRGS